MGLADVPVFINTLGTPLNVTTPPACTFVAAPDLISIVCPDVIFTELLAFKLKVLHFIENVDLAT